MPECYDNQRHRSSAISSVPPRKNRRKPFWHSGLATRNQEAVCRDSRAGRLIRTVNQLPTSVPHSLTLLVATETVVDVAEVEEDVGIVWLQLGGPLIGEGGAVQVSESHIGGAEIQMSAGVGGTEIDGAPQQDDGFLEFTVRK